ncbi:MAG: rhodanese-like domain-containing protein [Actinobacteria bacterium]|nr:rhodanese-like domain-containing protein [Actinomycetota bacterium]
MEKKSYNNFLKYSVPAIRILVGLVFFVSGLLKIIDISSFRDIVISLGLFNGPLSFLASIIIPVLELLLGLMLLLGIYIRVTAIHINVLIILFSWVTFYVLNNKPELLCGCFGNFFNLTFSTYHFIVLLVLFIFNLVLIVEIRETWSLEKYLRDKISKKRKMLIIEILTYIFIAIGIILIAFAIYNNLKGLRNSVESENTAIDQEASIIETSGIDEPVINILSVDEAYQAYIGNDNYLFVDVRTVSEYEDGHIEGALLMPLSEIGDRLSELPMDRPIVVYCNGSSCNRSGTAAAILVNNGFTEVYDLGGTGIIEWIEKNYPND